MGDVRGSGPGPSPTPSPPTPPATMGCVGVFTSFPGVGLVIGGRRGISTEGFESAKLSSTSWLGWLRPLSTDLVGGTEPGLDEVGIGTAGCC